MINVALIDEQEIFRAGVVSILCKAPDIAIIGQANAADDIRELWASGRVDVLIAELPSCGRGGADMIKRLKSVRPSLIVLILTCDSSAETANRALKCGAAGYLTKDSTSVQIISSIRGVASGRIQVSPPIAERLISRMSATKPSGIEFLTDRELDIFLRLARGESCTHMANSLLLSVKTISTYKARVMEKMDFSSVAELVKYAVAHKLVPEYSG